VDSISTRRSVLRQAGALGLFVVGSGCTGSSPGTTTTATDNSNDSGPTEIAAGPNGNLVFTPKNVEISIGETVTWNFKSGGHNVSAKPKDHPEIKIPDGAEPFASYEGHKSYQIVPKGESYSYTFETPGEYTYVCIPHTSSGMIGTVMVSE
jgi:plastocyanin